MSETILETAGTAADEAGQATVRVPRQIMHLLEQSYGSRERILDWCLAFGVVLALAWVFRDQLQQMISGPSTDPNVGRDGPLQPNTDLAGAFPAAQRRPDLYTYNMPASRTLRYAIPPSGTAPPVDPSQPPRFPQ